MEKGRKKGDGKNEVGKATVALRLSLKLGHPEMVTDMRLLWFFMILFSGSDFILEVFRMVNLCPSFLKMP